MKDKSVVIDVYNQHKPSIIAIIKAMQAINANVLYNSNDIDNNTVDIVIKQCIDNNNNIQPNIVSISTMIKILAGVRGQPNQCLLTILLFNILNAMYI